MNYTQHIVRQRAEKNYAEECRKNGAMMQGGFGFLHPDAQKPYLHQAWLEIIAEEEQEEAARENGQFGAGA